jgi:L-iditol 2-dehydrogenase
MKAARLHGIRDLRIDDVREPEPTAGEVLLAVKAVGVCGSDLHHYLEGSIGALHSPDPFILGHEFAAEVLEGGTLPPGTLVAVDPNRSCGTCEWCREGHTNLCPNVQFAGVPPYPGALSEYVTARPEELVPLPPDFDATTGALLEPLGVAIHGLDLARLRPMASVAVIGLGPIGLLLLQVARDCGAGRIVAIDPLAYRRALASELGADAVAATAAGVLEATDGRGVDVVLEATNAPEGPQHAAEAVRIGGRLVLVGIPTGNRFAFDAALVRRKGLTIKMSRRMRHVYPRAIAMVQSGRVDLAPLATHRFALDEAPAAFALQADYLDGVIKSVILPGAVGTSARA